MDVKTEETTLWVEDGGMVLCEKHIGGYLRRAIAERPRARTHSTPFGTCERIDLSDPEWVWFECETCKYG